MFFIFFKYFLLFVGNNILKLNIIQNSFNFEDKNQLSKKVFQRSNTYLVKNNTLNSFEIIKFDLFDSKNEGKKNKNIQSALLYKKKFLNMYKDKNIKSPIKNNNDNLLLINESQKEDLSYHITSKKFIYKNIEKLSNEQSVNQLLKKNKTLPVKMSSFKINDSKMRTERIKMYIFFCCYNKKLYAKIFKNNNSEIIHWYYINSMQIEHYLKLIKQFHFIEQLLLNESQIHSLEFLKKINLSNQDEKEKLLVIKHNNIENEVINYFKTIFKSGNYSKSDAFIYNNLSETIKKNIL